MILTVSALAALTVLGGTLVRARQLRRRRAFEAAAESRPEPGAPGPTAPVPLALREAFGLEVGDVVLLRSGEEAWLSGALVFDEGAAMAVLFSGPDAGGARYVLAHRTGQAHELDLLWLREAPTLTVREGVHVLEHEGQRLQRTRRRPFALQRLGEGAPDLGPQAVLIEYDGELGAVALVVRGRGAPLVLAGRRLLTGSYDVLPGSPEE